MPKSVKATLTMSSRGVITLPVRLRNAVGLSAEDQLIAEATPEGLLLRPAVTLPVEIYLLEDARRNLASKAPAGLPAMEKLLSRLHTGALRAARPAISKDIPLPEKEKPVLLAAIRHRCEALVTGDNTHFGRWYGKAIGGVRVCSPRSAFEETAATVGGDQRCRMLG
jgi:bifunctional DNA-binding transcriptional regulator/antitoxin component of YhaV-PrlF toxin-antitoxin module